MRYKLSITVILLLLVIVFALQNAAVVEIRLLFWEVALPRSLLIITMLIAGIVIGWFSRSMFRIVKTRESRQQQS